MEFSIQYISILIELLVAVIGLMILFGRKRVYGLGFFITFGIYVFYDLTKLFAWNVSTGVLYGLFFVASVSALAVVWGLYKRK
jgi:hypothetical protein